MEKHEKNKKIGIIILVIGIIIAFGVMAFYPMETKGAGILILLGAIISTAGVYFITKNFEKNKRFLCTFVYLAILLALIFVIDYVDILNNNHPPRFEITKTTIGNKIMYKTPFFDVYRINQNTINEYYIVDDKKEFTMDTIPTSEFNRVKSGIDKIINYKDQYIGNNSNDGNLISHLPLSEYGYTFEIDSKNFGLTINYKTDWSSNDQLYMKKSLLYNSVSIFALIDNVKYLKFNFGETSYSFERQEVEEIYPNYSEIVNDKEINIDNFNKYVEDMMKDEKFVNNTFNNIFEL